MTDYPRIDITPIWARLNDELLRVLEYVPDDKMNWSPRPELWNFRGILLHIADARDNWMGGAVKDGEEVQRVWFTTRRREELAREYRRTWARLERFLADPAKLDATYTFGPPQAEPDVHSGHWIAFHLLEHDIHHRGDILHYLALLGIETPEVGVP